MSSDHDKKKKTDQLKLRESVIKLEREYLILPVKNDGIETRMKLLVAGKITLDYAIKLPSTAGEVDWFAFFSIKQFKGKDARLSVDSATEDAFNNIKQVDAIPNSKNIYSERLRPQYHFTSKTGWLNDPNGLIWYKGEYHMFYQHNPTSLKHGNMTWGHAVSEDLIHWREKPKVLFPEATTGTCFSGAAFIDYKNQLERKTGEEEVLVLFYLRTNIGLCLAYSNDRGDSFTDFESNPVLTHEGARIDTPRPFWYEKTNRWIAPTYDFFSNKSGEPRRCVGFYSSNNLIDWKFESRVEQDGWGDELCGCVDFFQLPLDDKQEDQKWVMILIDGSYIVGDFDGHKFLNLEKKPAKTEDRIRSLVIQGHYYATMTWHNAPDSRRVQIAWMRNSELYPQMPFNQQMNFPSELSLHSTKNGPRLRMMPIEEIEQLRIVTHEWSDFVSNQYENSFSAISTNLLDIELQFYVESGDAIIFGLRGFDITYVADEQLLSSCGTSAKLIPVNGLIELRILLDRSSLEVYGNKGEIYIPHITFPCSDELSLKITCKNREQIRVFRVHELESSWGNV